MCQGMGWFVLRQDHRGPAYRSFRATAAMDPEVQPAAVLLWAGAASERIAQIEARMDQMTGLSERTARLEAQMTYIRNSLLRIETKLDRARPTPLRESRP